jgi:hypothetical protein
MNSLAATNSNTSFNMNGFLKDDVTNLLSSTVSSSINDLQYTNNQLNCINYTLPQSLSRLSNSSLSSATIKDSQMQNTNLLNIDDFKLTKKFDEQIGLLDKQHKSFQLDFGSFSVNDSNRTQESFSLKNDESYFEKIK